MSQNILFCPKFPLKVTSLPCTHFHSLCNNSLIFHFSFLSLSPSALISQFTGIFLPSLKFQREFFSFLLFSIFTITISLPPRQFPFFLSRHLLLFPSYKFPFILFILSSSTFPYFLPPLSAGCRSLPLLSFSLYYAWSEGSGCSGGTCSDRRWLLDGLSRQEA